MLNTPSDISDTADNAPLKGDGIGERLFDDLASKAQHPQASAGRWSALPLMRPGDIGHRMYDYWKAYGLAMIRNMPEPQQDKMLSHIGMPHVAKWLQGNTIQLTMLTLGTMLPGHGLLYRDDYNHRMLAEDGKGRVRPVAYEQFYTLFPPVSEEDPQAESRWPKLVLTSHHARAGDLKDMTAITHGIEALMKQCFKADGKEKHFDPLEFETGDLWHPEKSAKPDHQKLMISYACDVDRNPFLNGAALLSRVNELEGHTRSKTPITRNPDHYARASQSAFRLAKVMLQCLVTEPERIDPDFHGFIAVQPGLSQKPLYIRPDAGRVAQHLALIGYSKGGNVVSDAMRILVDELMQQRSDGTSLFYAPENGRFEHSYGSHVSYSPMSACATRANPLQGAKNIVRHIPLLSLAAIEVPLSERMEMAGVRRVSINNLFDFISGHTQLRRSQDNDEVIWVNGTRDLLGHAPADALGTKEKSGYILNTEAARRRVEEYFCALYGAAAISNLQFHYDPQFENENRIAIIPAAGTSDMHILEHCDTIEKHLTAAGFTGVHVGPTEWNASQILIHVNEPLFVTENTHVRGDEVIANVEKLAEAFKRMRATEPDLVVNQAIDDQIDAHYRHTVDALAEYAHDTNDAPGKFSKAARAGRANKGQRSR